MRGARIAAGVFATWGALVSLPAVAGTVTAPVFEDVGLPAGLARVAPMPVCPAWYDIDLDGVPEPVWTYRDGVRRLVPGPEGSLVVADVAFPKPQKDMKGDFFMPVPIDVDRDGVDELFVVGTEAMIQRVAAPGVLEEVPIPVADVPLGTIFEAAAGDLNRDGLADIVVGTAIWATERVHRAGCADLVYMNRGRGRFERTTIEPHRLGSTNGVTIADLDGDGDLDLVESINYSQIFGPSRVLLNVTEPGAAFPTFVEEEAPWDPGTNGMGVAVEDVDGDGDLDMFNTSAGQDILVLREADGSWRDATQELGFFHESDDSGLRNQWAPTFADLNADGRIDFITRHGGRNSTGFFASLSSSHAPELVYLMREDGTFERGPVPFDPEGPGDGRQLALGDFDQDGLPDVALGGYSMNEGFWMNTMEVPAGTRAITVRLAPTVSDRPATGARVTGTCGASVVKRYVSAGGHFGSTPSPEVWLGFPDCAGEPTVEVAWPSGAVSSHAVPAGAAVVVAPEPLWVAADPETAAVVALDPAGTGRAEACLLDPGFGTKCCAEACEIKLKGPAAKPTRVWLDGALPMALPPRAPRWNLFSTPTLPLPGGPVTWTVVHSGPPATFDPEAMSLFVEGEFVPWSEVDLEHGLLRAASTAPTGVNPLRVTLFPLDLPPKATWLVPAGALFDPAWFPVHLYSVLAPWKSAEDGGFHVYLHATRDAALARWSQVDFETGSGVDLPVEVSVQGEPDGRLRFEIPWTSLEGVDAVRIRDGWAETLLPIHRPPDEKALLALVETAVGGVIRPRLVAKGDLSPVVFSVRDALDHVLPLPASELKYSVMGGEIAVPTVPVNQGGHDHVLVIQTDGEPGEGGEVRVSGTDGRLLGRFSFTLRAPFPKPYDLAKSWAEVSDTTVAAGDSVYVLVFPENAWGDGLGADAEVHLEVAGGEVGAQPTLWLDARFEGEVRASGESPDLDIDVFLFGDLLASFSVEVTGETPAPPEPGPTPEPEPEPEPAASPVLAPAEPDDSGGVPEAEDTSGSGGCSGAAGGAAAWGWFLVAAAFFRARRGRGATPPARPSP